MPFPTLGNLPDPGIKPKLTSLVSPAQLTGRFFTTVLLGKFLIPKLVTLKFFVFFLMKGKLSLIFFFTEIKLIYNVVLVSDV